MTVWALCLKARPQLEALDVMIVLALWVLLDPVSVSEVCEADRAPNQASVDHLLSESDDPHLLEHTLVDSLLKQVDTELS